MSGSSFRLLVQIDWPTEETTRLWDGAGPLLDANGELWGGVGIIEGMENLEQAMNGEASTLNLTLNGVATADAQPIWLDYTNDQIIGAVVRIMIQLCDDGDQPTGDPEIVFTGTIDNILFTDIVTEEDDGQSRQLTTITVEVVNRFTLRRLSHGGVLSNSDQQARSAVLNPGDYPDLFCERVPMLEDKTITWPRWN